MSAGNEIYGSTAWAMKDNVRELRNLLVSLGLDEDLATATLERLLPDDVIYEVSDE